MENFIKGMLKAKVAYKNEMIGMRVFNGIQVKEGYVLSIQCSEGHYCSPRKLNGINSYNTFEVAIKLDDEFVYPSKLDTFERKTELDSCYEGTVFGFVPKDLVEDLYNFLNR